MTKNKSGDASGYMELVICVIAIVCSALPVMTTFKENVVYEVEMIGWRFISYRVWIVVVETFGLEK